jgi:hypothetical protein
LFQAIVVAGVMHDTGHGRRRCTAHQHNQQQQLFWGYGRCSDCSKYAAAAAAAAVSRAVMVISAWL